MERWLARQQAVRPLRRRDASGVPNSVGQRMQFVVALLPELPTTWHRRVRSFRHAVIGALLLGCDATTSPSSGPPLVWAQLDAGTAATCGVTVDGDGYCWGVPWAAGSTDTSSFVSLPRPLPGHRKWRMIEVGGGIACGLTVAQEAICWGPSWSLFDDQPRQVKGDQGFVTITVGYAHACGLTAAGAAWCWGDDARGALGLGYPDYYTAPRDSAVQPVGGHTYVALRAGPESTCGLLSSGDLLCWGGSEVEGDGFTPHAVQTGFGFTALSFGGNNPGQVCTIGGDFSLNCFGYVVYSQLPQPIPTGVTLPGGGQPRQVAVGGVLPAGAGLPYTYVVHQCAVTTTGAVSCWGGNDYGQLGDSSLVDRALPAMVVGLKDVASVTAGGVHTCALTQGGSAYCWGWNGRGQLGIGSKQEYVTRPTPVLSRP